jgi:predicted GNAT family acetyltransferase
MSGGGAPGPTSGASRPDPITVVTNRPDRLRYEITVDGELAGFATYADHRGVRTFVHTEIDERFAGMGLASLLIADALADVRERGMTLVPQCPFVNAYLHHHPEDTDLLAPGVALTPESAP